MNSFSGARFFNGRTTIIAVSILAMVAAGGLSATASSASSSRASSSSYAKYMVQPTKITQTVPLNTPAPKGKSIVYILNSIPADTEIGQTMAAASKALGWKYSQLDYDPSNPASIQEAFSSALVEHPTFVAIGGVAPAQFGASTLKAYAKAGVPIIAASTFPVNTNKTLLGTPNSVKNTELAGSALADWFAADSASSGQALLVNVPIFPLFDGFVSGFQKQQKAICSACSSNVLDITATELGAGQTVSTTVAYLQAHPSIKYVFFCLGNFADGITSALSAASLNVKVGGQGMDQEGAAALAAGTEAVWTATSNYYTGYSTMDFALRHLEKMSTTGDLTSPFQLLTSANIGSVTNWNAPYNALAQFEKLWKVPVTKCTVACSGS